jgi:hypothetical protein
MATITKTDTNSGPAERKLIYLVEHGDDFMKIELLRPALHFYERALELHPGNPEIERKITECRRLLAFERRTIWILAAVGAIIVTLYLLL